MYFRPHSLDVVFFSTAPKKVDVLVKPTRGGILQGVYLRITTKTTNLGSKMMVAAINASIYINAESKQFLPKNPMLPFFFFKSPGNHRAGACRALGAFQASGRVATHFGGTTNNAHSIRGIGISIYLHLTININKI